MKFECHINITNSNDKIIDLLDRHAHAAINKLAKDGLASHSLTKAQLKKAITKGALWHTRGKQTIRIRRLSKKLKLADQLHFYYNDAVLSLTCPDATLVSDHKDYSLWYKPYGMLCQGSKWSDHLTIDRFVQQSITGRNIAGQNLAGQNLAEKHLAEQRPCFIVHRLDRAASGLIIIAHSKTAAQRFSQLFEHHGLSKIYQIISHGDHRMHPQPEKITLPIDNKASTSFFTTIDYEPNHDLSLIEVKIESGRKHQIRKHAASIGLPVVGDRLHGKAIEYAEALNLQLCAVELSFICPFTQQKIHQRLAESLRPKFSKVITLL